MRVQADLFSGRPNPEWMLSTLEAEELARRFGRLRESGEPVQLPGSLGYRGLVVTGVRGRIPECDEVRARGGLVLARCRGSLRGYADPERALESWLLGTAEGRIDPGTLELLRREAGK